MNKENSGDGSGDGSGFGSGFGSGSGDDSGYGIGDDSVIIFRDVFALVYECLK